jgi:transposase-like protein
MNEKVTKKCQDLGFCCPYAYFTEREGKTHKRVAKELDVAVDTVRYNRRRLKDDNLKCQASEECRILKLKDPSDE